MMRLAVVLLAALAACSAPTVTTTTEPVVATTTTSTSGTTTTAQPTVDCPAAPYELNFIPAGIGAATLDSDEIEPDVWTSIGGTQTTFWGRPDGTVAIALIRGALPAVDWPGDKGQVEIDGTPAAVGPHPDGSWVAGWYEEPGERCDLFTMVFYPPWSPPDVEQVLAGMNRVGG